MKKYLLTICFVAFAFFCYAQKVNKKGQKLIKTIECIENPYDENNKYSKIYNFSYNTNNELTNFEYSSIFEKQNFTKVGNEILWTTSENKYEEKKYYLNEDNLITKCIDIFYVTVDGKSVLKKIITIFKYKDFINSKDKQPIEYECLFFYKGGKFKVWTKQESNSFHYSYNDGMIINGYNVTNFYFVSEDYNKKYINDTNIDISILIGRSSYGYDKFIGITEWLNLRGKYLQKDNSLWEYEYLYDEKGNLVNISVFRRSDNTCMKNIKITYVY